MTADAPVTRTVARYIMKSPTARFDPNVLEHTRIHLLDGLVALFSGSTLPPGGVANQYAQSRRGLGESSLPNGGGLTNPEMAALVGGMCAHADETDDVNDLARVHAGSSIVPAAMSMAEHLGRSGADLLDAVAVGYDVACSVNIGAWESLPMMQRAIRTPHGLGQSFGAAAAAAALTELTEEQHCYVLSYIAQQVSGIASFYRDQHHIGKAFASAGMQASNGVRAVEMVRAGFTDILDVFEGAPGVYDAFGESGDTARLLAELGSRHHVAITDIKQYPIGMPIQAAAEALERICQTHKIGVENVKHVEVRLPTHGARLVNRRSMPDISLQYVLAVVLADGGLTFDSAHDYQRHRAPATEEIMDRIELIPDPKLDPVDEAATDNRRTRIADVCVTTHSGEQLRKFIDAPRGSRHNPFDWEQVANKAHMVIDSSHGSSFADDLIAAVGEIHKSTNVRELRSFFQFETA